MEEQKVIKSQLMKFDVINGNNRIYTEDCFKEKPTNVPLKLGFEDDAEVIGESSLTYTKDGIFAESRIISSFKDIFDLIVAGKANITTSGYGELASDGKTIENFEVCSVVVHPDSSTWAGIVDRHF